jgi:glucose dehydrogenase
MDNYSETKDPFLRALDPQTGKLIGEIPLPTNANGAPITYTVKGKQFIVIPIGGASQKAELVALALPDAPNP